MNCKELVEIRKKAVDARLMEFQARHTFDDSMKDYSIVDEIVRMSKEFDVSYPSTREGSKVFDNVHEKVEDDSDEFMSLVYERFFLELHGTVDMEASAVERYIREQENASMDIFEAMEYMVGTNYQAGAFIQYLGKLFHVIMFIGYDGLHVACIGYSDPSDLHAFSIEFDYPDKDLNCHLNGIKAWCFMGDNAKCKDCHARMYSNDSRVIERDDVTYVAKTFVYMYMTRIVEAAVSIDEIEFARQKDNVVLNGRNIVLK